MVERDDLADELDGWLAAGAPSFEAYETGEEPPPLNDDAQVDRLLRRRHRLLTERARITDVATAEVRRIREWESDRTAGIDQQAAWVDRGLEQYARQVLPDRRIKSLSLPNGVLKLTQPGAPSVEVVDLSEFVTWCLLDDERDRFLHREIRADKAELKRAVKLGPAEVSEDGVTLVALAVDGNGETVPGVRLTKPAEARFSVTGPAHDVENTRTEENAE